MQARVSNRSSFSYYVAAIGVVGLLAATVIVLAVAGISDIGQDARVSVAPAAIPQPLVTSDALYAQESAHDMTRSRVAAAPLVTSDTLFALEAAQAARQRTAQTFISSDALFALEAANQPAAQTAGPVTPFITSDELYALEAAYSTAR
jgi:hypothetical protein